MALVAVQKWVFIFIAFLNLLMWLRMRRFLVGLVSVEIAKNCCPILDSVESTLSKAGPLAKSREQSVHSLWSHPKLGSEKLQISDQKPHTVRMTFEILVRIAVQQHRLHTQAPVFWGLNELQLLDPAKVDFSSLGFCWASLTEGPSVEISTT